MTHPGSGIKDRPSIASLVSSFDVTFSRYAAFTRVQAPRVEVIEELEDMFFVSTVTNFEANVTPTFCMCRLPSATFIMSIVLLRGE